MSTSKNLKVQSIDIRTGLYIHKLPKLSIAAWKSFCLQVTVYLDVKVELMVEGVKRSVNHQGKVTCRGWTGGRAGGGECCSERVPLTKSSRSKTCSVNEYWEVGGDDRSGEGKK